MKKLCVFILGLALLLGTLSLDAGQRPVLRPFGPIMTSVDFFDYLALRNRNELRFYDNGNYVGFEAPALTANQIWILPTADGNNLDVLRTDGSGTLSWASAGVGGADGTVTTVQEGDSGVGGADIVTLDFLAADFIVGEDPNTEVNIAIDYANGQAATTDVHGFLTDTDWDTFNGKQASDASLTSIAGLTYASASFIKVTAEDTYAIRTLAETAGDLEAEIEADIDTLANLTSIQGQTFTLGGNFVTQNNNVTINAVTATRTVTLNKSLTVGAGHDGTLTYSAGSKTLTVAGDCTVDQDLQTTDDPTFNDATVDKIEANECFTFDAVQTATGDGTTTVDWGLGNVMYFTFGAQNDTFMFTAPPGVARLTLLLKQDGTGSRLPTWPATVHWPGDVAPTLSTGAADVDIISFLWDGTNYFGLFNGNFE